jgi:hypothetical protein
MTSKGWQVEDISDVEIIAPNFKQRLSGVTSTIIQLIPVQRALGQKVAALGPGLPASLPHIGYSDLLSLWCRPKNRALRVWHARRNIEMLPAILHARYLEDEAEDRLHIRLAAQAFRLDEIPRLAGWMR